VAVDSAGPYASLHLTPDNHASTSPLSFFTGRMPFLLPNQQRQSTEGKLCMNNDNKKTKRNFKTENTLGMPKTRTESLNVFEKGTGNINNWSSHF